MYIIYFIVRRQDCIFQLQCKDVQVEMYISQKKYISMC